jgi:hypothetical protein
VTERTPGEEATAEEATALQDDRLLDHDKHLAEINGSVRDGAERLASIEQVQTEILQRVVRLESGQQFLVEEANVKPSSNRLHRMVRYVLWGLAGFVLIPQVPVTVATWPQALASIWVLSMIISAIACLAGALTDRWIFELFMLPVLLLTVLVFAVGLAIGAQENTARAAVGIMLLDVCLGLGKRWREVVAHERHERRKRRSAEG